MTSDRRPDASSWPAYDTDLDAGRMKEAVEHFSTDTAVRPPAGRRRRDGPRRLRRRARTSCSGGSRSVGPRRTCIAISSRADDAGCLVEGVGVESSTGEAFATFVASVQLDDDGLVDRYLGVHDDPGRRSGAERDGSRAGRRRRGARAYFEALDAGAFDEAADQFSVDVVYSHPPYRHTGIDSDDRFVFRGRDQLGRVHRQGQAALRPPLVAIGQRGPHRLLRAWSRACPDGGNGSFVSSLTLDGDGLIQRYVSFYCEPRFPAADLPARRGRCTAMGELRGDVVDRSGGRSRSDASAASRR